MTTTVATHVLLIEDSADTREMYADYLEYTGFRVTVAADAVEGLRLARTEPPDVILMDAGLPTMTGWDAVREVKRDPALRSIPVLMLTAHVFKDAHDKAAAAGADGFIAKPCLPDQLVLELCRALNWPPPCPAEPQPEGRRRRRQA